MKHCGPATTTHIKDRDGRQADVYAAWLMQRNSPGIAHGRQSDITVWTEFQDTMLCLDPNPKELDVLGRVCTNTSVLLFVISSKMRKL